MSPETHTADGSYHLRLPHVTPDDARGLRAHFKRHGKLGAPRLALLLEATTALLASEVRRDTTALRDTTAPRAHQHHQHHQSIVSLPRDTRRESRRRAAARDDDAPEPRVADVRGPPPPTPSTAASPSRAAAPWALAVVGDLHGSLADLEASDGRCSLL